MLKSIHHYRQLGDNNLSELYDDALADLLAQAARNDDLRKALKDLIASPNITECPNGLWSTADSNNYCLVRAAEKAISNS